MKVCVVTTSFPRWRGDWRGSFIWGAVQALRQVGADVCVVAAHSPGAKVHEIVDGVEVLRPRYFLPERFEILQQEGGGMPVVLRQTPAVGVLLPFLLSSLVWGVARCATDVDLIHANWTLSAVAALPVSRLYRRPLVLTVHGSDVFRIRGGFLQGLTGWALRQPERVVAVSRALASEVAALSLPSDRTSVVPDGVDTEFFRPGELIRPEMILYVGSLVQQKGVLFLVRAFAKVHGERPAARLVLVGDGPLRADLSELAEALGIADSVIVTGALSPVDVATWMRRARLFVLPSLQEGLGVVLLEALASGTPCIGTQTGGIPDIINDEVGRLVAPGDVDALVDVLQDCLSDDNWWRLTSLQAREYALQHYSWPKVAAQLMSIYQEVIDSKKLA